MCCDSVLGLPAPPMRPGPQALTRHLTLDPAPASVSAARAFVRDQLDGAGRDEVDTAVLMASELVTNAVLHARTPVHVGVVVDEGRAMVCVADRLPGGPLTPRSHTRDGAGGRGLALVAELSELWGTVTSAGGKTVWFTLPLSVRELSLR